MSITDNRVKGWLVCCVASLIVAIALVSITGEKEPSAAVVRARPVAASPRVSARPPVSAAITEPKVSPGSRHPRREDFVTVMQHAMQREDGLGDQREMFELGYRWVAVDPEAALDFVLGLPFDNTLLLVALADEWTRRDPSSAAAWAARLPEGAGRTRVLPSLVAVWAEKEPAEATRFASLLPPGKVRNEAIVAAISGWAQREPVATLAWAQQFLDGAQQEQVYTQAMFTWSRSDPVSAAEWLRSMPDGRTWDAATSALCGALAERHPALALSLATDISDQGIRNQRIENVARRWLEADRAAAENALIQSDLPAAWVSRLLQ